MRLLLVDDETRLTTALRKGLTADGFVVDVAADGVAALERAGQESYDVVVLDVMLPRLSGYEVVRRLRAAGSWVPVLMLSAKDGEHDQADALDDGADDYLTKPFSLAELSARLRAQLRRQSAASSVPATPHIVAGGDLHLDTTSVRARVAGRVVAFSVKEFSLLRFLLQNAPEAVSRAEILTDVWGSAEHFDPTIVDQYVSYVRRKLTAAGSSVSIATVRGVGYRLDLSEPG